MSVRILVVEDDTHVQKLLEHNLTREGWEVEFCSTAEAALLRLQQGFGLFIFDWMLPGNKNGLDLCKEARARSSIPILMLTARSTPIDIVTGLESGADDYITKPFEGPVLVARIRALLRRGTNQAQNQLQDQLQNQAQTHVISDLEITPDRFQVKRAGKVLELTASEFKILLAIVEARGSVLSRKKLLSKVQEQGVTVVDRIIDTHVYSLRKKLGASADFIETVRGVGYRIRDV